MSIVVNTALEIAVGTGQYMRTYNWSFYRNIIGGQLLVATMSDSIEYNRKSTTTDINGKQGSVWDIKAVSQVLRNTSNKGSKYGKWNFNSLHNKKQNQLVTSTLAGFR